MSPTPDLTPCEDLVPPLLLFASLCPVLLVFLFLQSASSSLWRLYHTGETFRITVSYPSSGVFSPVVLWPSHFAFLRLNLWICKIEIIMPSSQRWCEVKRTRIYSSLHKSTPSSPDLLPSLSFLLPTFSFNLPVSFPCFPEFPSFFPL